MKTMTIIFVLIFSFSLFAQENAKSAPVNDQSGEWMNKIASDPENRVKMMDMIIEQTKGNKEEMMEIVNSIFLSKDMLEMILAKNDEGSNNHDFSVEPRGIKKDSSKFKKMEYTTPIPRKELQYPR